MRERGTGCKRLRGNIWWLYYYHNGKYISESAKTSDEATAEKLLKKRTKAANTQAFIEPSSRKYSVDEIITLAREDAERKGNKTAGRYKGPGGGPSQCVQYLLDAFGGMPALNVTADDIDKYGDRRAQEGAANATINRELAILRKGYKLALRKNLIPHAPHVAMRSEKGNERQGFIEPALFTQFLTELGRYHPAFADVTECAFLTLLRRSNARNLTWAHVTDDELRLPGTMTKNGRPLALPLVGQLGDLIARRREARVDGCKYVFHRQGRPLGHFTRIWRAAAAAVGVPGLLMHDLRRSGARTLIREGVPEDVVLKIGNWKTRQMLSRYNVTSLDDLADAQEAMTRAFAKATKPNVKPLVRAS